MKNNKEDFYLNVFITILILMVINVFFIIITNFSIWGWHLLAINLSGSMIMFELIKYFRGSYNLFEPRGLIALVGTHYFFLAPLLFMSFVGEMLYVDNPSNWGTWVGLFCILNFIGILIYKFVFYLKGNLTYKPFKTKWLIDEKKFMFFLVVLGGISLVSQIYFFILHGGVSGIIQSKTDGNLNLSGFGWILMLGESLPILVFFGIYVFYIKGSHKIKGKRVIAIYTILILFFIFQLYIAGMRGSRSTTIFALFWCAAILHFTWRPFSKKQLLIALSLIMLFMVGYGFYKNIGSDVTQVITGEISLKELQETNKNRGLMNTLVSDVARVDTQSFLLYRLFVHGNDYDLAYGRTYVGNLAILIPSFILSDPPPTKIKEGTELMYGKGSYPSRVSSRVYGILGEGLLNFHVLSVPLVFLIWSVFVLFVTRLTKVLPNDDARWLIVPLLIQLSFTSINSDLDNIIFGLVKTGLLPFVLIVLSSKIRKENPV